MNTFGKKLRLTSFGESHGKAIGGILDGLPAGIKFDDEFLQNELDKRKPGGKYATNRKEADKIEILSGIFEGFSTGTPIGFIIANSNQHSKDYDNIKDLFRPGHADYTYFSKFGIRDHRGGGRSSARQTAIAVAGGAIANMMLREFDIEILSGVLSIGDLSGEILDFEFAKTSQICCLDPKKENEFKELIIKSKNEGQSVGSSVKTIINGVKAGLGEVLYDKLDARFAAAMMGINGVKAVEIGNGIDSSKIRGFKNNDFMDKNGFTTNNAGGILGGISTSEQIVITTYFKPTPSIFESQPTLNLKGEEVICMLKGRHDPCIGIRGSVVATAMARLVIADMMLLNVSSTLSNLEKIYK